ncbi:MAG: ABC transporter permease [Acidimicrobiales bacterium]
MRRHILRTVVQYGGVLLAAVILNFALPRLAPGDAIDYLLPPEQAGALTPEQRHHILDLYGLADPVPEQFVAYVSGLARGDLLLSVRFGRPVTSLLAERVGWTLLLVGGALVLSTVIGAVLGFRSAWGRGTRSDATTLSGVMFLDSLPPFFVALLLLLVFSVGLGWFPSYGAVGSGDATGLAFAGHALKQSVLPIATLTIAGLGPMYLTARSALVGELQEDYVLMAEAKGLTDKQVRRHAARNAFLPVSTVAFVGLGTLVGGAAVIETVFSYPGLGRLIYESVLARDYPVLQGAFLLLIVTVVVANVVNDLVYPFLDPRVRHTEGARR